MKHTHKILLTILTITLSGCSLFLKTEKSSDTPGTNENSQVNNAGTNLFSGSYFDLLSRGGSFVCSWSSTDEGVEASGITYVSEEKLRSEVSIPNPEDGSEMIANSIFDNEFIYTWSSLAETGTKMSKASVEKSAASLEIDTLPNEKDTIKQDYNQNVDFSCSPWKADNAKFTPPSNIEFTDLTQTLEQFQGLGDLPTDELLAPADICDICLDIPDESTKNACLANCQ